MARNIDPMKKKRDLICPLGFHLPKSDEGSVVVSSNGRWLLCDVKDQSKLYDLATLQSCEQAFVDDDMTVTAEAFLNPGRSKRQVACQNNGTLIWQAKTSVAGDRIQTRTTEWTHPKLERNSTVFVGKNSIVQFALLRHILLSVERHSNPQLGIPIKREYTITYEQFELSVTTCVMARTSKVACFFESGDKWVAIVVLYFHSVGGGGTLYTRFIGFDGQQVRIIHLPDTLNECTNIMYSGLDHNHFCFWTPDNGGAYMAMRIDFGEEISLIPVAAFATPRLRRPLAASGFSIYYRGDDERLWVWRLRRPQTLLLTAHFAALHSGTRSKLPTNPPIAPLIGGDGCYIHYTNED